MDYWEQKLHMEASTLDSILFFKLAYMSLRRPHPLWLCYQHAKSSLFQAHWSIFSSSVPHSNQNDLLNLATRISGEHHAIGDIINKTFSNQNYLQTMQLLLDPSLMPIVIQAVQNFGDLMSHQLLYFGRTWCYNIHIKDETAWPFKVFIIYCNHQGYLWYSLVHV